MNQAVSITRRSAGSRIGDILVERGHLTIENLNAVLQEQRHGNRQKLGKLLVAKGFSTEDQVSEALALQVNSPFIDLRTYVLKPELVAMLSETQSKKLGVIVLNKDDARGFLVGMVDPHNILAYDEVKSILKSRFEIAIISESALNDAIQRAYRRTQEMHSLAREVVTAVGELSITDDRDTGVSTPDSAVDRFIQAMFEDALRVDASDIHIEPQEGHLQIRFRIDGELQSQMERERSLAAPVTSRLKTMCNLDIGEKRLPQDGRFSLSLRNGSTIDVRLSTLAGQHGEGIVMRLLKQNILSLDNLGMPADMLRHFRSIVTKGNGVVLVTGPTGSGKTTTLYSVLSEINTPKTKIITAEDPVEYRLPGIHQTQINEKIGLTFASVLRSMLRQDPDVILVGEMRDTDTAQIALRAAMTGHLVFATTHTRDTVGTLFRIVDMGVPKFLVASAVKAIMAQRLLRKLCDRCSTKYVFNQTELNWLASYNADTSRYQNVRQAIGCPHCNHTGFRGRFPVYELMEMVPELIDAATHSEPSTFTGVARKFMEGRTMVDHAIHCMLEGRTTLEEVMSISNRSEE